MASKRTDGGKGIDDQQVHAERLAYAATEARAARDLLTYAAGVAVQQPDATIDAMAAAFAGEIAAKLRAQIEAHPDEFGIADDRLNATLGSPEVRQRSAPPPPTGRSPPSAATSSSSAAPTTRGWRTRWRA